jgi:hypothetical protein
MIDFNGGVTTNPALIDTTGLNLDGLNLIPNSNYSVPDWGQGSNFGNLNYALTGETIDPNVLKAFNNKTVLGDMSNFSKGVAGLQTLGSVMGAWNGYQQNKLAKQQLAFQKDAFNKEYSAKRNLTNSQLEDRQRNRVYQNEQTGRTGTMSVAEYMNKYGIK